MKALLWSFALLASACHSLAPAAASADSAPQNEAPQPGGVADVSAEPRKVVIDNSRILEIASTETGRQYELLVGLPPSYGKDPQRKYPVLYLMDGQWDFVTVNRLTGGLRYDQVSPFSCERTLRWRCRRVPGVSRAQGLPSDRGEVPGRHFSA